MDSRIQCWLKAYKWDACSKFAGKVPWKKIFGEDAHSSLIPACLQREMQIGSFFAGCARIMNFLRAYNEWAGDETRMNTLPRKGRPWDCGIINDVISGNMEKKKHACTVRSKEEKNGSCWCKGGWNPPSLWSLKCRNPFSETGKNSIVLY